jgi:hypothetical protein
MGIEARMKSCAAGQRRGAGPRALGAGALLLWIAAAATGCDGRDSRQEQSEFVVRYDSGGVEVVHNRLGAPEREIWALTAEPRLEIGGPDSDHHLFRVRGAFQVVHGKLLIVNQGSHELLIVDRDSLVTRVGRKGAGPGEFSGFMSSGRYRGDSLYVADSQLARVSVFDANGQFGRSFRMDPPNEVFGTPSLEASFADGEFMGESYLHEALREEYEEQGKLPQALVRLSPDGEVLHVIGGLRAAPCSSIQCTRLILFGFRPGVSIHSDAVFYAFNDQYRITIHDRGGEVRRIISRDHVSVPVDRQGIDHYVERHFEPARQERARSILAAAMDDVRRMPAFGHITTDAVGNLWVEEVTDVRADMVLFFMDPFNAPSHPPRQTGSAWAVYAPDGGYCCTVGMPSRFSPTDIGDDYVIGVFTDELGVESVRSYGLNKGPI